MLLAVIEEITVEEAAIKAKAEVKAMGENRKNIAFLQNDSTLWVVDGQQVTIDTLYHVTLTIPELNGV